MMLLAALVTMPALSSAASPAAVEPVVGGGQMGVVNQVFPQTFAARVIDATGAPVPDVSVYFQVDQCLSTGDGDVCPPASAYPFFEGPVDFVVVQSDANGQATTPPLTAGQDVGYFQ